MIQKCGRYTISVVSQIGHFTIFLANILYGLLQRPLYITIILQQILFIGFYSLPVISLTSVFSGGVLALQSYAGFSRFSIEHSMPAIIVLSIVRELGPVITGLMVAGRVGASISAEIGTMRVTEQIDALYTLSVDPIKYLVVPRVIASTIMLPCLVIVADILGIMGGYLVSIYTLGFNEGNYLHNTLEFLRLSDIVCGLVKAFAFGIIISTVSCFNGYYSDKGARGVGKATTSAVVSSSVLILVINYIITEFFVNK